MKDFITFIIIFIFLLVISMLMFYCGYIAGRNEGMDKVIQMIEEVINDEENNWYFRTNACILSINTYDVLWLYDGNNFKLGREMLGMKEIIEEMEKATNEFFDYIEEVFEIWS